MKTFIEKIKKIYMSVQDFFMILSKCWLSIVMLIVGAYAFLLNDQGRDIVTAFNESRHILMSFGTALCMLLWGIESWFGARLALDLSNTQTIVQDSKLSAKVPRTLGFLSITVFYISYLCFKESYWIVDLIILFLPMIIYWIVIVNRRKLIQMWNDSGVSGKYNLRINTNEITNAAIRYSDVTKPGKWFFMISLILFPLLVIILSISPVSFPSSCTPTVVVLLGIAVWTGLGTTFMVFEKMLKIPLLLITLVLVFFFSYINNNHEVRTVEPLTKQETITSSVTKWYEQLPSEPGKPKTLYMACGEGGGIRAAYWTASILASLTDSVPSFPNHLFALSSVSGSSLGVTAYNSILKYNNHKDSLTKQVRSFMKEDYLSPVLASFLFTDAFQRFLPVPIPAFDRARYLEWSWEDGWSKNFSTPTNPFSDGLQKMWDNNSMLPNLFLNSTHTESGRRSVASNISWNEDEWRTNNVSLLIGKDMPLSTSALLSARFPILTPGAKIIDSKENYWGTLVDGGYYDNYGVATASDIYYDIRKVYKPSELKIVVLMILNGDSVPENPKPIKGIYEIRTVPTTFLKARTVRPEKSLISLTEILTANGDKVITVKLDRNKKENLPLGWCLSYKAMDIMDKQINSTRWRQQKKQILNLMQ